MKKQCCQYCQTEFFVTNLSNRFCSPECRMIQAQEKNKQIYQLKKSVQNTQECAYCLAQFCTTRHNAKYCSPGCRENHENAKYVQAWANRLPIDEKKRSRQNRKNQLILDWKGTCFSDLVRF